MNGDRAMEQTLNRSFATRRIGYLIGLISFAASLPLYVSYENRPIAGRWSIPHATLMSVAWLAAAACAWWVVRGRGQRHNASSRDNPAAGLLELAVATWGVAYLIAAIAEPDLAGRIMDLNITGSTVGVAAAMECTAMAAAAAGLFAAVWVRSSARGRDFLLVVGSVAALALVGEAAARLLAFVRPVPQGFPTYSTHLWSERFVSLNSLGFRDIAHDGIARAGTRRVLVVGDSHAFGHGIPQMRDRFSEQLAAYLSRTTGQDWEPINTSRPDTHTLEHIAFLEQGLLLSPDLVVLLYVFNDIEYLAPA